MKTKRIFLACILLLAIISIGAVSAEENVTADDMTLSAADIEEPALADDEYITVNVSGESTLKYGEYVGVEIQLSEDTHGYIQQYFDSPDEDTESEYLSDGEYIYSGSSIRQFGTHTLFVKYFDGNKPDKTFTFPFTVTDYDIDTYSDDEYCYGDDYCLNFAIPSEAYGTLRVLVNGHEYITGNDGEDGWADYFMIKAEDLVYGVNALNMTFEPQDAKSQFKAKTVEKTFNATGRIRAPGSITYNTTENVTLRLPDDAEGKLTVMIDENMTLSSDIKDGLASVEIPKLDVGYHEIFAKFEGNYIIENLDSISEVKDNVISPEILWVNAEGKIIVETSRSGNISAYVGEEQIATAEITDGKAILSFALAKGYHSIRLEFNDNTIWDGEIEVIDENPNWTINISTKDVLKTYAYLHIENYPEYIKNCFELAVDGVKVNILEAGSNIIFNASDLAIGSHSYVINFTGDGYYLPTSASGTFDLGYMALNCRDTYVIGDDSGDEDCIYGYLPGDATGKVTAKINGKKVYEEDFDGYDDYYEYFTIYLSELGLKLNAQTAIEIRFTDAKYGETKRTVNPYVTYSLRPSREVVYGDSVIYIIAPHDLNVNKISLSIDGKNYNVFEHSPDGYVEYYYAKTTKDLTIGNHTAVMKYSGDATYPAMTTTGTVKVYPEITAIYNDGYDGYATLALPDDARGNLTAYANGVKFASVRPNEMLKFDNLTWGVYDFILNYTGDDYNVTPYKDSFSINPEISIKKNIILGEDNTLSIDVGDEGGMLTVRFDDYELQETLVNGKASIRLPAMSAGKHHLSVTFEHIYSDSEGDEASDSYYYYPVVSVINPIRANDASVAYSANANYKAEIKDANGNPLKSGKVTFYILDGKNQILKKTVDVKNGVATLSYKITKGVKTYTIKTVYSKAQVSKKLTVKHVVTLKSATVKKSAKKLVLTATLSKVNGKYLKNKAVTFKFNGKTYKAKTNSKGVAKVTIKSSVLKKLKAGKKVTYQATYLKDTVKKTAKVKK